MKFLLISFILLFIHLSVKSQDNIKTVTYSHSENKFTNIEKLNSIRKGDFYQFKFEHINLNLYKIVISKKDTSLELSLPSLSFGLPELDEISKLVKFIKLPNSNLISELLKEDIANKSKYNNLKNRELKLNNDSLVNYIYSSLKKENLINSTNGKILIHHKINEESNFLLQSEKTARYLNSRIDKLQLLVQKKLASYLVLNKSDTNFKKLSGEVNFESILEEADNIRKEIEILSTSILTNQDNYLTFISDAENKKIIKDKNNVELKKESDQLLVIFEKSISNTEKLRKSISSEIVTSWIQQLIYKENNASFSYTTLPMQFNEDKTTLSIDFIPQNTDFGLPSYSTTIQFPKTTKYFLDVGLSLYYAGLKSDVLSTKEIAKNDSTSEFKLIDEKNNKGEVGIASFVHFGWRPFFDQNIDWISINAVVGPALSLTNLDSPRVAFGAGLGFGSENMLSINVLYVGGYVPKKSNSYTYDELLSKKPENLTRPTLKGAIGFSIGYTYHF